MKQWIYASLIILFALITSCSIKSKKVSGSVKNNNSITSTVKSDEVSLVSTVWILREIKGTKVENPAPGLKEAYIVFMSDTVSVTGSGGCNALFGNYHLRGTGGITIERVGSTKMFCDAMDSEIKMINALREATSYKINGDSLVMIKGNKIKLLTFIAKKAE